MVTGALTDAVIGAAGVVTGAVVGAASGWWTATLTARHAATARRNERREAAYTEFLASAELLHRVINDWESVPGTQPADTIGYHVAQAAGSVYRSYVAVLVAGSAEASDIGADVDGKARAIRHWFTSSVSSVPLSPELAEQLHDHVRSYVALLGRFAEVARRELA